MRVYLRCVSINNVPHAKILRLIRHIDFGGGSKQKKSVGKVIVQHELEPFRQINEYNLVSENRLHYPYLFKT